MNSTIMAGINRKTPLLVVGLVLQIATLTALGQDALRSSLQSEASLRSRKLSENVPYNLKAGPVSFRLGASTSIEANDNINVSRIDPESDVIVRPALNINAFWPITQHNALNVSMGVGYSRYLENPDNDSLYLAPNSEISFDVFVSDFRINLHDRFSYVQDPLQQPQVSGGTNGAANFGTAQNSVGISVDWDLNKILLSAGYNHHNSFSTSSDYSYVDQASEFFYLRGAFLAQPELTTGVEMSGGFTSFDQRIQNDSSQYSIGPFIDWQLSPYMRLSARAGLAYYSFENNGVITNADNTSSYYANLSLEHQVNKYLMQSLVAGSQLQLGVNSSTLELYFVRHYAMWQLIRNVDLRSDLYYEHGEESNPLNLRPETFNRYGVTIGLGYQMTKKLHTGLTYRYTRKDSNQYLLSYTQNSISLDLHYRF